MNKNYISKLTLTTVSLACVCSAIAIEPSQATNIKKWQIYFFGDSGELVGEGSFSYDLDTETFIPVNFNNDGFYAQTGIGSFSANVGNYQWSLKDSAGYYWWSPETATPKQAGISRYGIFLNDGYWFFGDPYFNRYYLRMDGTQGSGTWRELISYAFLNEDYEQEYYKFASSGTWTAKPVPEPATLFGLIAVFGFGVLFPQKRR
jgi:hypothetical protein